MRDQVESRLAELKREFESGQGRLRTLEAETAQMRETLLRISGAIVALEELVDPTPSGGEAPATQPVEAVPEAGVAR